MKNNSNLSTRSSASRKAPTTSKTNAVDRKITRKSLSKQFSFAKPGVVLPGTYISKIVGVEESKTKAGEEAVDVLYELTSDSGKKHHVRMRYPLDGFYFEELCEALLDAGLTEDSKLSDAVGLEEQVVLGYPNGERIGSFISRYPADRKVSIGKVGSSKVAEDHESEAFDEDDQAEDDVEDDEFADLVDFLEEED